MFTLIAGDLSLLLIKRGGPPFEGSWALPGGFLAPDEDLDSCAHRELKEETGVDAELLFHFANFSAPDRDPRQRVVSIAYLALLRFDLITLKAGSDAADARWFPLASLPNLAFDHREIVDVAVRTLRERLGDLAILFALLPQSFTLTAMQDAYDAVAGAPIDKRNFRKVVFDAGLVEDTGELSRGRHRPARLYRRKQPS
ncbi:MAG: NUDIX domain-containing protein [Hyphomonadaceae bacterium]|nr:NUDIX domain-containing protein [Hyphomonadaceae bacterium]